VLGDVNDFQFSETVEILGDGGLSTFVDTMPEREQYSYVFEGNSQVLDQILGTPPLLGRLVEYDIVHVNSEFAVQASDHEPSVARINMIGRP
jgi:predicted extracellular nuclease